jgi:hypothetical protein
LDDAGRFQFSFAGEASGVGDGTVGSDLAFDGSTKLPGTDLPSARLDGALDLTTCSISGTWQSLGTGDGGSTSSPGPNRNLRGRSGRPAPPGSATARPDRDLGRPQSLEHVVGAHVEPVGQPPG